MVKHSFVFFFNTWRLSPRNCCAWDFQKRLSTPPKWPWEWLNTHQQYKDLDTHLSAKLRQGTRSCCFTQGLMLNVLAFPSPFKQLHTHAPTCRRGNVLYTCVCRECVLYTHTWVLVMCGLTHYPQYRRWGGRVKGHEILCELNKEKTVTLKIHHSCAIYIYRPQWGYLALLCKL